MTKKEFIKYIEDYESLYIDEQNINKAMKKLAPEFNGFYMSRYHTLFADMLSNLIGDTDDWVGYWIYELDFGKKATDKTVKKNNKYLPIRTPEDLYNLIINN